MASVIAPLIAGLTPQQLDLLKDQNHDTEVYTCAAMFSILAIFAVTVRVTSRQMKKVVVGIDDVLIIIAVVITLAQTVYICFIKLWYTVGTLQCTALFLTKISVLILFHRIFITPAFRLAIKVIGVIILLWWISTLLADTLICIPIEYNWNPTISAHCGSKQLLAIISPIPWIVKDLVILLMPLPMVWNLHLPRLQRVGLEVLFLLGGFAMVSSRARHSTFFFQCDNVTYYVIPATVWTIIESSVTIISACLIVSRSCFLKLYPSTSIGLIRERGSSIRRSSQRNEKHASSSEGRQGRWQPFSSFKRLPETPPAVTAASLGAPFEFDVEKAINSGSSGHAEY